MSTNRMPSGSRIVLNAFGSLGDIHPFIAIGIELRRRGHNPFIATHASYQAKIESEALGFRPVRPDALQLGDPEEILRKVMDLRNGPEFLMRTLMDHLQDSYDDMAEVLRDADLLVTHPIGFAAPLIAEKTGLKWVSTVLAPMCLFSRFDPPVMPGYPRVLTDLYKRVGLIRPAIKWFSRQVAGPWFRPYFEMRKSLGLPPGGIPILHGQHSPHGVLALFSEVLGVPQPDWPPRAQATGFCFYDKQGSDGLSPLLEQFLDDGPPPVVFTLGSAACLSPGEFYRESLSAARKLGHRAVLLTGPRAEGDLPNPLPEGAIACEYAPYSAIFPRSGAIVHHGGVGTTGQALRAGKPMLVMPFSQDQPDNAARAVRLGVARSIPRNRYIAERVASELRALLEDPACARRAEEIGRRVRAEDGVRTACDAIEALL